MKVIKFNKDICSHCGDQNSEVAKFSVMWVLSYGVCQSCISKAFRGFTRNK